MTSGEGSEAVSDEYVPRAEYTDDRGKHARTHVAIRLRLRVLEDANQKLMKIQEDQLSQLRDIKWLVILLIFATAPRLVEFVKGLWH